MQASHITTLQRSIGNRAVQRLLGALPVLQRTMIQRNDWRFPQQGASKQADSTLQTGEKDPTAGTAGAAPILPILKHIKALFANSATIHAYLKMLDLEIGQAVEATPDLKLEKVLSNAEGVGGFPPTTDVLSQILQPADFNQQLRSGRLFHDPNVSPLHGAQTHRIQWYCIIKNWQANPAAYKTEDGTALNPQEIFRMLGTKDALHKGNAQNSGYWRQLLDESNEALGASGSQPEVFTTYVIDHQAEFVNLMTTLDYKLRLAFEPFKDKDKFDSPQAKEFKIKYVKDMTTQCVAMAASTKNIDPNQKVLLSAFEKDAIKGPQDYEKRRDKDQKQKDPTKREFPENQITKLADLLGQKLKQQVPANPPANMNDNNLPAVEPIGLVPDPVVVKQIVEQVLTNK